jgi:hypothetical protein
MVNNGPTCNSAHIQQQEASLTVRKQNNQQVPLFRFLAHPFVNKSATSITVTDEPSVAVHGTRIEL